jgi:uncharacterized protein YcbK (DUF882 family)
MNLSSKRSSELTEHFSWHEALYLPQWDREGEEKDGLSEGVKRNLRTLFSKMELIRSLVASPIKVHCAWRPVEYNKLVKGASNSAHIQGMACDFSVSGLSCDQVREMIVPHLEEWNLRMENLPGSSWVHVDFRQVGPGGRYFKP